MNLFKRLKNAVGFSSEMAKTKVVSSAEDFTKMIVKLDPKGASETQLRLMTESLEKASGFLETKRLELSKESKEAIAAETEYSRYKKATLALNDKINSNPELEETLGQKLESMIQKTGDLKELAEQERMEADSVQEIVDILDSTITAKFDQIQQAKRAMDKAQRNIHKQKAVAENRQAKEDLEALTQSSNDFSFALDAMNDEAAKLEADNNSKARLQKLEDGSDLSNDSDIQALLDEVDGTPPNTRANRLADL